MKDRGKFFRNSSGYAQNSPNTDGVIIYDDAATANKFILIDSAVTTALTGTIATGSALTAGFEIATAAGDIVLDPAGGEVYIDGSLGDTSTRVTKGWFPTQEAQVIVIS